MGIALAIKQNGKGQRADTELTQEIASALVRLVFDGESLYRPEGYLNLHLEGGDMILSRYTLNSWIKRGNVIPGTGNELRAVLNKAREDYRTKLYEKKRDDALEKAVGVLNRAVKIRTNVPIRNMFGQTIKNPDGSLARRESATLFRAQIDAAKYITERLDPERWGQKNKVEGRHLVFSLSDLRKAKQEMEKKP